MTAVASERRNRPVRWILQALVMAVFVGVLGMHALGPGGATVAQSHAGHEQKVAQKAHTPQECAERVPTSDGLPHLEHADGTCAAAGLSTSYAPPALARAEIGSTTSVTPAGLDSAATERCRPPPELSELQLLRI